MEFQLNRKVIRNNFGYQNLQFTEPKASSNSFGRDAQSPYSQQQNDQSKAQPYQSINNSLGLDFQGQIVNTYESVPKCQSPKESSLFTTPPFRLVSRQKHRNENRHLYQNPEQKNQSSSFIPNEVANRIIEDKIQVNNRFERVRDIISGDVRGQFKFPKVTNGQSLNKFEQVTKTTRYDPFKRNAILQLQNNFSENSQPEFIHEIDHLKGHENDKRITSRDMFVSEYYQNPDTKFTKLKAKNYIVNPITSSCTYYQQQMKIPTSEFNRSSNRTLKSRDKNVYSQKALTELKKLY